MAKRTGGTFTPASIQKRARNALITKISRAEIRTTHLTGLTTDLGIELGKLIYWNRTHHGEHRLAITADRKKLRIHASLIASFQVGVLAGALCFNYASFMSTVPLALLLAAIAVAPALER